MDTIQLFDDPIDRDHSQGGSGYLAKRPIWTDRCTCRHIAASHGPYDRENLQGPCLTETCGCQRFAYAAEVAP